MTAARSAWETTAPIIERRPVPPPKPVTAKPVFLTVAEVAKYLRVAKMTVYRRIHEGDLEAIRVGNTLRIRSDSFHEFMRNADVTGQM